MRVPVIGGTRFVGPRVVKQLVEKGQDVIVFNRGETGAELPEGVGVRMKRCPGAAHPPAEVHSASFGYAAEDAVLTDLDR